MHWKIAVIIELVAFLQLTVISDYTWRIEMMFCHRQPAVYRSAMSV